MNKSKSLTFKQEKTLSFIISYQKKYNIRPTFVEIGQHLGTTAAAAQFKVDSLLRKKIMSLNNIYIINEPA